jgi:hypothetical protein
MNAVSHDAGKRYLKGLRELPFARTLLVDAVLERRVNRSDKIYGSSETYGELEKSGKVILNQPQGAQPGNPSKPFIGLPLILLNSLLNKTPAPLEGETEELQQIWSAAQTKLRKLFRPTDDTCCQYFNGKSSRASLWSLKPFEHHSFTGGRFF